MSVKISVLTPTWNRAAYLSKVWEGLDAQSYRDFEWIVANDGSDDNTIDVVRELASKSGFPVTLINASCRIGKSRMDNEAVAASNGDFIIWCDSDDVFMPSALKLLVKTWEEIPLEERHEYCGVTALCDTKKGVLGNKFYDSERPFDMVWNELFYKLGSDLVIFTKANLVRSNPFKEVDFLIPESSVWNVIGIRKTKFIPVVLERKSYQEANCLSYSGHMSYNRGNAYSMAITRDYVGKYLNKAEKFIRTINYLRYCAHGDMSIKKAVLLWVRNVGDLLVIFSLLPVSQMLVMKDMMQHKVRKTHIDYERAKSKVMIEIHKYNVVL